MADEDLSGFQNDILRFEHLLGRGGMGSVYKGVQLSLNRTVAIKIIHERLVDNATSINRFLTEARMLGKLVHPNVIACHDVGDFIGPTGKPIFYMLLEYVDGQSLGKMLKETQLPVREILEYHRQAAEGLAEAHKLGIIHRDIKPDNIIVTKRGVAKLADFGLAKGDEDLGLTQEGRMIGTPYYMPPEAWRSQELTVASDIYSFGCSLFHAVTGSVPYKAKSAAEIMQQHLSAPIPALASIMPELAYLQSVINHSMAKNPIYRFQSAEKLAHHLGQAALKSDPGITSGKRQSVEPRLTKTSGRISERRGGTSERRAISERRRASGRSKSAPFEKIAVLVLVVAGVVGLAMFLNSTNANPPPKKETTVAANQSVYPSRAKSPATSTPAKSESPEQTTIAEPAPAPVATKSESEAQKIAIPIEPPAIAAEAADSALEPTKPAPVETAKPEPSVRLTAEGDSFTPPAKFMLTAETTGKTVAKVEFYQGTRLLGKSVKPPYVYNCRNVTVGTYSYTAKVTDENGESTSNPITVTVARKSAVQAEPAAFDDRFTDIVTDGLIGYWRFDEKSGAEARDASPSGNDGILMDAATWTGGRVNGAVGLDGKAGYVQLNTITNLPRGGAGRPFSLSCWIYPGAIHGAEQNILNRWDDAVPALDWLLSLETGKGAQFAVRTTRNSARHIVHIESDPFTNSAWHHLVAVYEGHAKLRLYVDGDLVQREMDAFEVASSESPDRIFFGAGQNGKSHPHPFSGKLDEVRIYDRALSGEEARLLFTGKASSSGEDTGLTGQYFNKQNLTDPAFTRLDRTVDFDWGIAPPGEKIPVDFSARWTGHVQAQYSQEYTFYVKCDDGARLWVDGKLLIDQWVPQDVIELKGSISLTAGVSYSIRLEFFDCLGEAVAQLRWSSADTPKQIIPSNRLFPTAAAVRDSAPPPPVTRKNVATGPDSGLIGHWRFDEKTGTIARDSSGAGNHATLADKARWAEGRMSAAVAMDEDGYVSLNTVAGLPVGGSGDAFSVCCWFYCNPGKEYEQRLVARWDDAKYLPDWLLRVKPGSNVHFLVRTPESNGAQCFMVGATGASAEAWHHLAGVYLGEAGAKIYLDGVVADDFTRFEEHSAGHSSRVTIGCGQEGDSQNCLFSGKIDDVRIYNRALSEQEVQALIQGK